MGNGIGVLFCSLKGQHFAVALLGYLVIAHQGAGVAEIAQRIGQFLWIVSVAIVGNCGFPCCLGLSQIAAMKEDSRAVLVIL
jgi:hypothetical protein